MNPWQDLPSAAPYALPIDREELDRFNRKAPDQYHLCLDLLPEPFLGSPLAPVVLLNANPGLSKKDSAAHLRADFRTSALENLRHSHAGWPLYLLDPALRSPGYEWWSRHLKPLAEAVGDFQRVAASVFVAETHGYHAKKYRAIRLPSQEYTRELIRAAIQRDAVFIVMRARRDWLQVAPELQEVRIFPLNSAQNVSVSRRNCPEGFDRAVKAIGAAA